MISNKGFAQVLRNIAWHSSEKVLRMLIGFLVGLWLARYLGPEQFGRFNYIMAWLGIDTAAPWAPIIFLHTFVVLVYLSVAWLIKFFDCGERDRISAITKRQVFILR